MKLLKKEKMIDPKFFREYFEYVSPSDMYKNLNERIGSKENKAWVNAIKDKLAKLIKESKSSPISDAKKKIELPITNTVDYQFL